MSKMSHTEYMEAVLELSKRLDQAENLHSGAQYSPTLSRVRDVMDKILAHHFDTSESIAMREADIAADGGAK